MEYKILEGVHESDATCIYEAFNKFRGFKRF